MDADFEFANLATKVLHVNNGTVLPYSGGGGYDDSSEKALVHLAMNARLELPSRSRVIKAEDLVPDHLMITWSCHPGCTPSIVAHDMRRETA